MRYLFLPSERNVSARENHPSRGRQDATGKEKNEGLQTMPKLLTFYSFLARGDFPAHQRSTLSTMPVEKWSLLVVYFLPCLLNTQPFLCCQEMR